MKNIYSGSGEIQFPHFQNSGSRSKLSIRFRFVFSFCVFVLCFRFVFSFCVFVLCFRFAFSLSVFVLKTCVHTYPFLHENGCVQLCFWLTYDCAYGDGVSCLGKSILKNYLMMKEV